MSIGCSGTVAFGVAVEEDWHPFPWPPERQEEIEYDEDDDPCELGGYLARRQGIINPYDNPGPGYDHWEGWPEGQEPPDWQEREKLWSGASEKAAQDAPVEILQLGHYEGTSLFIVALKGTKISTYESNEAKGFVLPSIEQPRIDAAAQFCTANDICPFEEPQWLLASSMG